jgi:hypothetical protein
LEASRISFHNQIIEEEENTAGFNNLEEIKDDNATPHVMQYHEKTNIKPIAPLR